ncbi:MAG: 1-aminocyclopropane-1-carboxylate deaminase [Zunongwangia sp.]|uniref:1-aminocyclopropane-1-carboxylate deaminase-like protein n=2 Tax=Zunongwangia profunda TaxID=398743 RepID=D5BGI6_ZUNPS|nr:pyridoxal-phosphate dependent enzyme [Zunongwangia profunda]ADF51145.1 1-aminocyclopropane-1-carboxylate deaminase-like protein [Zunongwangia profunda SM-A87]MAO37533.1 1-aminocyclopropane-1-carboxylate deaminase [Zunongwangia sp.]HAJ81143.1 1-aminocyclopropane-1-carboxylate deaminase/D-cysteine desulfhydrase [Zunongwangia profunda]HCV82753.1 1-aminocyclopropane-1-carboxylate deaminase/D-cysteine desulfhydrase [Zunongwangia profunda]|tara:strand:+ start:326 stop:1285 length:960 start_codon:yes stop_codon:yes gene_type:complete
MNAAENINLIFHKNEPVFSRNDFIKKFEKQNIEVWLKREDLLHPEVSGNKFRKLKYNVLEAKKLQKSQILTFGGAFSNHIAATAAAGKLYGIPTIGVIRGEELGIDLQQTLQSNPTLKFSSDSGMKFHFVSRENYRRKNDPKFIESLHAEFGDFYLVPEGGTNQLAIAGCEEILSEEDKEFDIICVSAGTGGTASGLINASGQNQSVLVFSALKGDFLKDEISHFSSKKNWTLVSDDHFGGYAKINEELISFINEFKAECGIQLDPIYTGKMMFGIFEMIKKKRIPEKSRILAVHTGGLQGIAGMNRRLEKKKMSLIIE